MIFLCIEIDHPSLFRELDSPEGDHVLASQFFRIEEVLHANGVQWMKRTPRGLLSLFNGGDPSKAAITLAKEFQSRSWQGFGKAKLRIAIHSGEAEPAGQDYVGPDLTHCRKVLEAAPPGLILLTVPAVHFVPLPPGGRLQDMGVHFLKDLSEPRTLYALVHPDLEAESLAPPRSLQNYPQNFTPQNSLFFGREEEIQRIGQLLAEDGIRLVTLVGPGGFGKTRLALQSAAEVVERFEDGVFIIHLAPLLSDQLIVGTIANTIKFLFYGTEDPKTQLLGHLREKQMLLVMDNFEHLIEGHELVEEILAVAPRIKIIVTTRESLRIAGERVLEVRGLRYPGDGEGTGLESSPAAQLFCKSAQRLQPTFVLKDEDKPQLTRICQLLEGMPLGLELSATWVVSLPMAEIATKIESSRDFLATSMPHLPPRHRSLRAVFEYSWILLTEQQKKVLRSIAVFRGSFNEQAARKVGGATETLLLYLSHKSLLRVLPNGRFEIHELLKYYAKEKLFDDPVEKEKVFEAHGLYFSQFTAKRSEDLYGASHKRAIEEITQEIGNIREGWRRAVETVMEPEMEGYLQGLYFFYDIKGLFQEAVESFRKAEEGMLERYPKAASMPRRSAILLARLKSLGAHFLNLLGQGLEARRRYEEALKLLPASGCWKERGFTLAGLGVALEWQGHLELAHHQYEKAWQAFEKAKDRWGRVWSLSTLGHIEDRLRRPEKALLTIQKALSHAIADKDARAKAYASNLMGDVLHDQGRFEESRVQYQNGLSTYLETGERRGIAWSFINLGQVAYLLGDLAGARQMFLEGLSIFRDLGDLRAVGWSKNCLGQTAWAQGDYVEALRAFEEALENYRHVEDVRGETWVMDWMANVLVSQGKVAEAERLYHQAYDLLLKEGPEEPNKAWYHYHLGEVALAQGDPDRGRREMDQALKTFEKHTDRIGEAVTRIHLARIDAQKGAVAASVAQLQKAMDLALASRLLPILTEGLTVLALLNHRAGNFEQALALLQMAVNHPACRRPTQEAMEPLLKELEAHFSLDEREGAVRWARASRLENVVADWLASLETERPKPRKKAAKGRGKARAKKAKPAKKKKRK